MDLNPDLEKTPLQIRSELANMSFEKLQELKEKLGAKVYNEAIFGTKPDRNTRKHKIFKRDNKNRPRETTSKRPVPLVTTEAKSVESTTRDPRFDSLCGTFKPKAFERSYNFLKDVRQNELEKLKNELKNTNNPKQQEQIQYLIQRIENQNREKKLLEEKELKIRQDYQDRVKQFKEGKHPGYVRKSEKKVLDLVEKYEDLKKSGKLEKHITKHRKRNTQKARKNMTDM